MQAFIKVIMQMVSEMINGSLYVLMVISTRCELSKYVNHLRERICKIDGGGEGVLENTHY